MAIFPRIFVPLLLRYQEDHYQFRGLAYVHGMMQGELEMFCPEVAWVEETFDLR